VREIWGASGAASSCMNACAREPAGVQPSCRPSITSSTAWVHPPGGTLRFQYCLPEQTWWSVYPFQHCLRARTWWDASLSAQPAFTYLVGRVPISAACVHVPGGTRPYQRSLRARTYLVESVPEVNHEVLVALHRGPAQQHAWRVVSPDRLHGHME